MEDARRAAEVLAEAGATQVWVYGSVAKGTQTAASDIDLVAVFDDLDYQQRRADVRRLRQLTSAATGQSCDVLPTDHPEWRARSEGVSTSFESGIRRDGATMLLDVPHRAPPDWDKAMVLPVTNEGETWVAVTDVERQVERVWMERRPDRDEMELLERGSVAGAERVRRQRAERTCESAAMAIETLVKAFRKGLPDQPLRTKKSHDLEELKQGVPQAAIDHLYQMLLRHHVDPEWIDTWRSAGSFTAEQLARGWDPTIIDDQADRFSALVCEALPWGMGLLEPRLAAHSPERWRASIDRLSQYLTDIKDARAHQLFRGGTYQQHHDTNRDTR